MVMCGAQKTPRRARRAAGLALLAAAAIFSAAAAISMAQTALDAYAYDELADSVAGNECTTPAIDVDALTAQAPHAAAWLTVNDTPISYPVAEPGDTMPDGYYLDHDIWGQPSAAGCPYIDPRSSATAPHILVYGHRMGWSQHMFGALGTAWQQTRFEQLGCAHWTPRGDATSTFEPLCAMRVPASYAPIQQFHFIGSQGLSAWLTSLCQLASARSTQWKQRAASATQVLTLVTCAQAQANAPDRTLVIFCSTV